MTIKTEELPKDQKLKYSLQYRIYLYRQSLKKCTAGAVTLVRSKLLLTQQLLTYNQKYSDTSDLQMALDTEQETDFAGQLKYQLNKRSGIKMRRIEKKKLYMRRSVIENYL